MPGQLALEGRVLGIVFNQLRGDVDGFLSDIARRLSLTRKREHDGEIARTRGQTFEMIGIAWLSSFKDRVQLLGGLELFAGLVMSPRDLQDVPQVRPAAGEEDLSSQLA